MPLLSVFQKQTKNHGRFSESLINTPLPKKRRQKIRKAEKNRAEKQDRRKGKEKDTAIFSIPSDRPGCKINYTWYV